MKLLGKLLGSKKVVDSGISAIDKLFFTNEEKSDEHLKFLSAYEPFKVAQRVLALLVISVYLFVFLIGSGVVVWGIIAENLLYISASKELLKLNNETLGWPVITILAFYFAGGTVNSFRQMKKRQPKQSN